MQYFQRRHDEYHKLTSVWVCGDLSILLRNNEWLTSAVAWLFYFYLALLLPHSRQDGDDSRVLNGGSDSASFETGADATANGARVDGTSGGAVSVTGKQVCGRGFFYTIFYTKTKTKKIRGWYMCPIWAKDQTWRVLPEAFFSR